MFYLFVFLLLFVVAFLEFFVNINKEYKRDLAYMVLIILALIAGTRFETGVDWRVYSEYMDSVPTISEQFREPNFLFFEPGFVILCSIIKNFGGNVQSLFFIVAVINVCVFANALNIYTSRYAISLLVYFCIQYFMLDMSGIRQAIAVNTFFYSTRYIVSGKPLKYAIAIFFACTFHVTSILLFPFYLILKKRFSTISLATFSFIGMLFFLLKFKWIAFIMKQVAGYFSGTLIGIKLESYSGDSWSGYRTIGLGFFMNIALLFIVLFFRRKISRFKNSNLILNLFIVNIAVYNFFFEISEVSIRLRAFFLVGNVIMFFYLCTMFRRRLNRFVAFFAMILYCFYIGRPYFLEMPIAVSYNPYQNYIIYKVFNLNSTGKERLLKHERKFEQNNK